MFLLLHKEQGVMAEILYSIQSQLLGAVVVDGEMQGQGGRVALAVVGVMVVQVERVVLGETMVEMRLLPGAVVEVVGQVQLVRITLARMAETVGQEHPHLFQGVP